MIPHLHPYVQTRKGEIDCVALDNSPFHAGRDPRGYADVVGEHAASVERDREACNQNQDARRSHTGVPPRLRKLQTRALMGSASTTTCCLTPRRLPVRSAVQELDDHPL